MISIEKVQFYPINIPYKHSEISAQVSRAGVSNIVVKITTSSGEVGWGECCNGSDTLSVLNAAKAMLPFVVGKSPWFLSEMKKSVFWDGLWQFRKGTANFAWAGIDMAILDIQSKLCGQPLYNLLGGVKRESVDYFYYLERADEASLISQCEDGLSKGFTVFYLKIGIDIDSEESMLQTIRKEIGDSSFIRVDVNTAWTLPEARRNIRRLKYLNIDFYEGPVPADIHIMKELRKQNPDTSFCINEGLWSVEDTYNHILNHTGDVLNFSPYWVSSLSDFKDLAVMASYHGIPTCKHTHGEFGIAAHACQHALLTLPLIVNGNQQTAYMMQDDILVDDLPTKIGPQWGLPLGEGLGIEVDEDKLKYYHEDFVTNGQFLPYVI